MLEVGKPERKEHVLIFEPLSGGHRAEFVGHLVRGVLERDTKTKYTFVVGRGLGAGVSTASANVFVRETTEEETIVLKGAEGPLGSFKFRKVLQSYLDELQPDNLIIMDLTFLELALCFKRLSCRWSAILFVQYPELLSCRKSGWKRRLKFHLKEMKTGLLLRDPLLHKLYLLNGDHSCSYLNRRFRTSLFYALPDPVSVFEADESLNIQKYYSIDQKRCIFLFFGSVSPRKGADVLIDALRRLPGKVIGESAFLFCGRPEVGYASEYRSMMAALIKRFPQLKISMDEQFVSEQHMNAVFAQSDWVLLPYTRPEYSSGILGHAAAAETPVIGPASGLLGRQIREYGLGLDVNISAGELAKAITMVVEKGFMVDQTAAHSFVQKSSPEKFAAVLLEG